MADLEPDLNPSNMPEVSEDTIHPGFIAKLRSRRLARKRKMTRYVLCSDSSTEEDERIATPLKISTPTANRRRQKPK